MLLKYGWRTCDCVARSEARTDNVGQGGAMAVWRDGDMISDDLEDRRPVLERPLRTKRALGPSHNRGLRVGNGIEILKSI